MMKKTIAGLAALLLVFMAFAPIAIAEDNGIQVSGDINTTVSITDDNGHDNGSADISTDSNTTMTTDDTNTTVDNEQSTDSNADVNAALTESEQSADTTLSTDSTSTISGSDDNATTDEVKTMQVPHGAEVRLLQLEKAITRNILVGNAVLTVIEKNHTDVNVSAAQDTLDKMQVLLDELNATSTTDMNLAVSAFVSIKKQSIDLTQEFRKETAPYLSTADKNEIRAAVKDIDRNALVTLNQEIQQSVNQLKANKVEALLNLMHAPNADLIASIEAGTATNAEISAALRTAYAALSADEKVTVNSILRENIIKDIVKSKDVAKQELQKIREHAKEREQQLMEKLKEFRAKAKDRVATIRDHIRGDTNVSITADANTTVESNSDSGSNDDNGGDN